MKSRKKEISANADDFKDSQSTQNDKNLNSEKNGKITDTLHPFKTQLRIISVLIFLFSLLVILTILSYTRQDIAVSSISFNDLFRIIQKDPVILARQSITQNWLGLLGAYISNALINGTFGYAVIIIPLLLIYFSIELYKKLSISARFVSNASFALLMTLLISGFCGVLSKFSWIGLIPFEWTGKVGYFLAAIITSAFGTTTSLILFILIIFISIFYKLDFKFSTIISSIFRGIKDTFKKEPRIDSEPKSQENVDSEANNINDFNISNQSSTIQEQSKPIESTKPIETATPKPENLRILINPTQTEPTQANPLRTFVPKIQQIDFAKITVSNPEIQKEINKELNLKNNDQVVNPSIEDKNEITPEDIKNEPIPNKTEPPILKENTPTNEEIEISKAPEIAETEVPKIDLNETINQIVKEKINQASSEQDNPKNTPAIQDKPPVSIKINKTNENKTVSDLQSLIYTDYWDERISYTFPSIDLLTPPSTQNIVSREELELNARILQEKLETFKIVIDNMTITPGPVVTQYEFVPAPGIKISRIEALADDLAMALKAKGIRIIAPIPGKGTVGVEIPNSKPSIVRFSEVVTSDKFQKTTARLPIALGKTINGEVFIEDLTRMPHLLIAGSTGSGKSVGINTIINSLLYKIHPSELKFVIIDPKKVELSQYSMLSQHYLATSPDIDDVIITNPKDAVIVLKAAVREMEHRYDILADVGQRNIYDYNQKIKQGILPKSDKMLHYPMPYIVVIVDELADLMLTASKEIEEPITRLAQMARAVGIHLVIATQRPSVDVITGLIKANFPARVAYLVASRIDSRTILDQQGAEQLLGNGDMLIMPPGTPKPIRVQNAFISTDDVERICEMIGNQQGYSEPYLLPSLEDDSTRDKDLDYGNRDPLFEDAARLIIQMQQASVSMLQRRMK
ncbi:DNA translocase FtsK 4TM domain-containing protein, partial [bacterium]|nr:DNA translocase FtsK 4TM domain-containing protein [bacterium]